MFDRNKQPNDAALIDALRLFRSENVGPVTYRRLIETFGTATAALENLPTLAKRGGKRAITICPVSHAERELAALTKAGGTMIAVDHPAYPKLLKHVEDAPPVLSVFGHVELLKRQFIGMVGARNASINGMKFAARIAEDLGRAGFAVASGLARGIDTAAHKGSLQYGTVAVVAGGVDNIYPRENTDLYHAIVEAGAVISEMPLGTTPQATHFPRRNRIISGVSYGTVVVEATARSGSLITARFANEQGREVFAVPGSPLDPRAEGPNKLIKQGATLTQNYSDVLSTLEAQLRAPLSEPSSGGFRGTPPSPPDGSEAEIVRAKILNLLSPTPISVDEVIRESLSSPSAVSLVLLELELAGRLERHPGNRVSLLG